MNDTKLKVGILGCGNVFPYHLRALQDNHLFYDVVAVADVASDRAIVAAAQCGARSYGSLQTMLQSEALDLIVLLTPSGLHPSHARECAVAQVACLSEKPFGCSYTEALEVVEFFERRGVQLFVCLQVRHNSIVRQVKTWFDEKELGRLFMIQVNLFWHRSQAYYDADAWRGTRQFDGGALMNQGSHYIDLMQWFGGPVKTLKSEVSTLGRQIECEDTGAAIVKFESDAVGVVAVSMLAQPGDYEASLTLLTERATIKIGGKYLDRLDINEKKGLRPSVEQIMRLLPKNAGYGHEPFYYQLHKNLRDPAEGNGITGREGLASLKIISDIYGRVGYEKLANQSSIAPLS